MLTGTPIPKRSVEARTTGHGPVITYKLSPEELEKYRSTQPITHRDAGGRIEKRPIRMHSDEQQKPKREDKKMRETRFALTKEQYLQLRFEGKSRKEIAKEQGITSNNLENYWLKKWGIKDPTQEEIAMAELQPPPMSEPTAKDIEAASVQTESPQSPAQPNPEGIVTEPGVSGVGRATDYASPLSETTQAVIEPALQFLVLRIPLIDGTWDRAEQRLKVHEELDEYAAEVEASNIDYRRAASELFDVAQSFAGLIRRGVGELLVDGSVDDHVRKFFEHHNDEHIAKIMRYADERGWTVVSA